LVDRINNKENSLGSLSEKDKKTLKDTAKELEKWLKENPNSTKKENEEKLKEINDKIENIIKKAEIKNHLNNLSNGLEDNKNSSKEEINKKIDKNNDAVDYLKKDEDKQNKKLNNLSKNKRFLNDVNKKDISMALDEMQRYIQENPNLTKEEMDKEEKKLNDKLSPIEETKKN
jgi:ABC-type transporter Mla subunit MlaD